MVVRKRPATNTNDGFRVLNSSPPPEMGGGNGNPENAVAGCQQSVPVNFAGNWPLTTGNPGCRPTEEVNWQTLHEGVARSGRSLRAPDEAVEPKMKEFIFGERNGIYIIDLQKTLKMFKEASKFVQDLAADGRIILFVAPSARRRTQLRRGARCGMFYVKPALVGGLLTNWVTVQKSVKRLKELDEMATDGRYICFRRRK